MARVRLGGIKMGDPPARVRLGGIKFTGSISTTPRVRLSGIKMSGGLVTEPRVRLGGIKMSGLAATIITEFEDLNVQPGQPLTITAVLAPGSPEPEEWVWTQVSGPTVEDYETDGPTLTMPAPSILPPGGTVEFAVGGLTGGVMSPLTTIEINVPPETFWSIREDGTLYGASRLLYTT